MTEAAERGVRAIVVRAGDFLAADAARGSISRSLKEVGRGRLTYPGPLDACA